MSSKRRHTEPVASEALRHRVWRRMRKSRMTRVALWMVGAMIAIAVMADFLASSKPLFARHEGKTYFPVIQDYLSDLGMYQWEGNMKFASWKELPLEAAFWPPVRYAPGEADLRNSQGRSPFGPQEVSTWKERHFLGTDELGRDVLSGLIHGTRISLSIGVVAMGIAALIGVLVGAFAGYYGDDRLRLLRAQILLLIPGVLLGWFYGFHVRFYTLRDAVSEGVFNLLPSLFMSVGIFVLVVVGFLQLGRIFKGVRWLGEYRPLGVDMVLSRMVEIIISLPMFILLITLASLVKQPSIYFTMVVIGLTSWTGIARYMRGEMLRTRSMGYIEGARALGFGQGRIILRHALPNSLAPVLVAVAFGIAHAITLESSLSFLGIGTSMDEVTWGSLLKKSREDTGSWWLAVFPGFAIFLTITCFNIIGESLRDALDPRLMEK